LLDLPNGNSLTVGIHGPWRDGKTTVLNIIRSKLEASPDIVVVRRRHMDASTRLGTRAGIGILGELSGR
jgi:hypothetical protein